MLRAEKDVAAATTIGAKATARRRMRRSWRSRGDNGGSAWRMAPGEEEGEGGMVSCEQHGRRMCKTFF